ncbi:MAG: DUF3037 domain-containing protein [Bacteroidota bacterium]
MPGPLLFEYAVIRLVPRVEREEFLNVGVVLYCSGKKFLHAKFHLDKTRLSAFTDKLDVDEIGEYLRAFEGICIGNKEVSPIARMPIAERFRWLTATRSTVVQSSKVHPGLCTDPGETLERLYGELVL